MAKLLDEIHPGEILLEEFMKPLGIDRQKQEFFWQGIRQGIAKIDAGK